MKSILSTACLIAFTIGMASTIAIEYEGKKAGIFDCFNNTLALSCMRDIQQFTRNSIPEKYHRASIVFNTDYEVLVENHHSYVCTEFTKEILSIGNCKNCVPFGVDSKNPKYCIEDPPVLADDIF